MPVSIYNREGGGMRLPSYDRRRKPWKYQNVSDVEQNAMYFLNLIFGITLVVISGLLVVFMI